MKIHEDPRRTAYRTVVLPVVQQGSRPTEETLAYGSTAGHEATVLELLFFSFQAVAAEEWLREAKDSAGAHECSTQYGGGGRPTSSRCAPRSVVAPAGRWLPRGWLPHASQRVAGKGGNEG
jgi:hypothetical protein